jgi:hypothetical protein
VQRQEDAAPSPGSSFHLTPPSLLRPADPYARYRPDFGFRFRFDEERQPWALARGRALLSPPSVLADVAAAAPVVRLPGPVGAPASVPAPTTGDAPPTPAAPTPAVPSPDPQSPTPRPGGGGDVVSALLAIPQVGLMLTDVQNQFTGGFKRYWESASLGERIGFVSSSVVVGGGILAGALGFEGPRDFVLPRLNDLVIPVPGLNGYGLEFRFGERDVMVGAHLDVGLLLPSIWGFGPASFTPVGGPPGSDPNALPPLSRKADGSAVPVDAPSVAAGLRARAGAGGTLDGGTRAEMERALGTGLEGVRIHTDGGADRLAHALSAQAFTTGRDVFFRAGRYDPATADGRRLLAHELVHVAQQARAPVGGVSVGGGLSIGEPGGAHEREADAVAGRVVAGAVPTGAATRAPARATGGPGPVTSRGTVQRQPHPGKQAQAVPAEQARKMAPPPWTDYFDEVVPAVLEAVESNEKVGLDRAMWLITQAYGEQSPGVTGPPSRHRNRLFNEQAAVEWEGDKIKRVLPGQESEGVYLYNLKQNESPTRDKKDIKSSPTFGYDTPERAAHHHLEQLEARWGTAWQKLTQEKGSFEQFADGLKAAGYAKANDYATSLKAIKHQVQGQVRAWLKYRLPEMRARVPDMEAYLDFLRGERELVRERLREEPDPVGSLAAELRRYDGMVRGMELQLADVTARLGRLERFASTLGMDAPQ